MLNNSEKNKQNKKLFFTGDAFKILLTASIGFLIGIFGFRFALIYGKVDGYVKVLLEICSILCEMGFSLFGFSAIIQVTSLKKQIIETINETAEKIAELTTQVEYINKTYSVEQKNQLLHKLYCPDVEEVLVPNMLDNIIKHLMTGTYVEKDESIIKYDFDSQGKYLTKTVNKKLVLINSCNGVKEFKSRIYFNEISNIDVGKQISLNKIIINGDDLSDKGENYFKTEDNTDKNTLTYNKVISFDINLPDKKRHEIEYEIKYFLPHNDINSIFTSKYLVEKFKHTIILHKKADGLYNDIELSLFSLLKSSGLDSNKSYHYEKIDDTPSSLQYKIESEKLIFPGDGYSILFKQAGN